MKQTKQTRRAFNVAIAASAAALAGVAGISGLQAQQKTVKLGITLPLTGADADGALKIRHGFETAIDEANAKAASRRRRSRPWCSTARRQRLGNMIRRKPRPTPRSSSLTRRGCQSRPGNERRRQGDDANSQRG